MISSVVFGLRPKSPTLPLSSIGFQIPGLLLSVKQQDLFSWMKEHTLSPSLLGWHHTDVNKCPFTFHLHVNQPLGVKIKKILTASFVQENTRGDKVGIMVKNPLVGLVLHLLYYLKGVYGISRLLFICFHASLTGNHESLFRIHQAHSFREAWARSVCLTWSSRAVIWNVWCRKPVPCFKK